jgi:hypothetical protein
MAKINVLTITFTDGSKEQYRDCVISVQDGVLTVIQRRPKFLWSTSDEVANYPLVNIREYHFDHVKA